MIINFMNKVALVTGASSGIGEATALQFAKLGAKLALVGRNVDNLAAVAKQCEAEKGEAALAIVADLSTDAGCEKTAKEAIAHFGRLDVLVNNAGVGALTNLETTTMEAYDRVFNTNVRGVYNLTRLMAPELIKTKGNIVNISSVVGSMVAIGHLPYSMSKAALDHFTRLTGLELATKGVRVNAVSPGVTISKFRLRMVEYTDEQYQDFLDKAAATAPLGKVCTPEDIAKTTVYLASDLSALVTGTNVAVDAGIRFGGVSTLLKE